MMRTRGLATLGSLLVASATLVGQRPALDLVRVSVGGERMPVLLAQKRGIFEKQGIRIEFPELPPGGSSSVRAALANGDIDVVHSIVDNAVHLIDVQKADVVIVAGGAGSPYELVVQPGIASIQDLKGKTLIVDAPDTALAVQMKKILRVNGVRPGVDCELKPLATGAQRLVEMRANRNYAGAMLGPPTSLQAKREGFVSLASSTAAIGRLQGTSVYVRRPWASDHGELLVRYLAAVVEAERWLMAPAHRADVVAFIEQSWEVPRQIAEDTYAIGMGPGGWDRDLSFDVDAFGKLLALRAEIEGTWGGTPPPADRFYDLTYYRRALERLR